jgi:hypothetical protein
MTTGAEKKSFPAASRTPSAMISMGRTMGYTKRPRLATPEKLTLNHPYFDPKPILNRP